MPVRVDVPTRLRVDPRALTERWDDVNAALDAAFRRALKSSAENAVAPRGGWVGVRLNPPTVTWSGEALGSVPVSMRADIEAGLADLFARALRDAELVRRPSAPTPLQDPPIETIDPERYDEVLGVYSVPEYQGGKKTGLRVKGKPKATKTITLHGWIGVTRDDDKALAQEMIKLLDKRGRPDSGYLGAIAHVKSGFWVAVWSFPSGVRVFSLGFHHPVRPTKIVGGKPGDPQPIGMSAGGSYWLTYVGSADNVEATLSEHYRPMVEQLMKSSGKLAAKFSKSEIKERVDAPLTAYVKEQAAGVPRGTKAFLLLGAGSYQALWPVPGTTLGDGSSVSALNSVELWPIAREFTRTLPVTEPPKTDEKGEEGTGVGEGEGGAGKDKGAKGAKDGRPGDEKGGFVYVEGQMSAAGEPGRILPPAPKGAKKLEWKCQPFRGEPPMATLGGAGEEMRKLRDDIAWRLQIDAKCDYAANFLLHAANALSGIAHNVAAWETNEKAKTKAAADGKGNLGSLHMEAMPSPQIQFLRHLAETVTVITELERWVQEMYKARPDLIEGDFKDEWARWSLAFGYDFVGTMKRAVAGIFAMTCQVLFLQLLNASHDAIETRLTNIDAFSAYFEAAVLPQLKTIGELLRMQELLKNARLIAYYSLNDPRMAKSTWPDVKMAVATPVSKPLPRAGTWRGATQSFMDSLEPPLSEPPPPEPVRADHYELVEETGGTYSILDKDGHLWNADDLETAVLLRRGSVESVEPLVKQMIDLPEVIAQIRGGASARSVLENLLRDMLAKNEDIARKARDDVMYGFKASSISESWEAETVPGTGYALHGVHVLAHQQIGEFFNGDWYYAEGINWLFGVELGKEQLLAVLEFTGLVLLAILCPPLAIDVGIAVAAYHYAEAKEREEVYGALIDPEAVRSRAEIEAELFGAELGLALSFLPVAGEIIGEARAALRLAQEGVEVAEAGSAAAARGAATPAAEALAHLAQVLERGFAEAFVKEMAKAWLINKAIGLAVEPMMKGLEEGWITRGPTGGLERALSTAMERRRRRALEKVAK
jgi:hypothetical protein